jgi:hypothetical protein
VYYGLSTFLRDRAGVPDREKDDSYFGEYPIGQTSPERITGPASQNTVLQRVLAAVSHALDVFEGGRSVAAVFAPRNHRAATVMAAITVTREDLFPQHPTSMTINQRHQGFAESFIRYREDFYAIFCNPKHSSPSASEPSPRIIGEAMVHRNFRYTKL